jgi:hypothetical protein
MQVCQRQALSLVRFGVLLCETCSNRIAIGHGLLDSYTGSHPTNGQETVRVAPPVDFYVPIHQVPHVDIEQESKAAWHHAYYDVC